MAKKYSQSGALAKDFFYPPFSVLDARQGQWQRRKKQWLACGLKGELGRAETLNRLVMLGNQGQGKIEEEITKLCQLGPQHQFLTPF